MCRLACGSVAGHLLECGAQSTGGIFTDWQDVPDWDNIGFPIAECYSDGTFLITKPSATGGLVTPATVAEQLVYEIGNPTYYMLPDVTCDLTGVTMTQHSEDAVLVQGVTGSPPPFTYKVCATYLDGYRSTAVFSVVGRQAIEKGIDILLFLYNVIFCILLLVQNTELCISNAVLVTFHFATSFY